MRVFKRMHAKVSRLRRLAHVMLLTECRLGRQDAQKCDIEWTEWAEVTPSSQPQRVKTIIQ